MKMRHFGYALDVTFGPLKLFMTCNFADTYMPLTLVLFDPRNQERLVTTEQSTGRAARTTISSTNASDHLTYSEGKSLVVSIYPEPL